MTDHFHSVQSPTTSPSGDDLIAYLDEDRLRKLMPGGRYTVYGVFDPRVRVPVEACYYIGITGRGVGRLREHITAPHSPRLNKRRKELEAWGRLPFPQPIVSFNRRRDALDFENDLTAELKRRGYDVENDYNTTQSPPRPATFPPKYLTFPYSLYRVPVCGRAGKTVSLDYDLGGRQVRLFAPDGLPSLRDKLILAAVIGAMSPGAGAITVARSDVIALVRRYGNLFVEDSKWEQRTAYNSLLRWSRVRVGDARGRPSRILSRVEERGDVLRVTVSRRIREELTSRDGFWELNGGELYNLTPDAGTWWEKLPVRLYLALKHVRDTRVPSTATVYFTDEQLAAMVQVKQPAEDVQRWTSALADLGYCLTRVVGGWELKFTRRVRRGLDADRMIQGDVG